MIAVTATDFRIRAIELWFDVTSYENERFSFLMVSAKFNCYGFISKPRRLLGDVEAGPKQYN